MSAGQPQATRQATHRQRLQGRLGGGRDLAYHPRCCERTRLPGITICHGDAPVCRVRGHPRAVGVMTHTDGRGADAVSLLAANDCAGRADNMWHRFKTLHDAQIIGRMHDGTGAMGNEIEQLHGRTLAVQFGEVAEVPPPMAAPGKACRAAW